MVSVSRETDGRDVRAFFTPGNMFATDRSCRNDRWVRNATLSLYKERWISSLSTAFTSSLLSFQYPSQFE